MVYACIVTYTHMQYTLDIHVNERCRWKEEISKQGHTNNKVKQHNTPKEVTFPKKNELYTCKRTTGVHSPFP